MATDIGINFRLTEAYVTDGANQIACLYTGGNTDLYPTEREGATFGWSNALTVGGYNRLDTNDPRIAGTHSIANSGTLFFRLDVPAGAYLLHLALGDGLTGEYDEFSTKIVVTSEPSGTAVLTLDVTSAGGNTFFDATGTEYSGANWPTSETGVAATVAVGDTWLKFVVGGSTLGNDNSKIAHLRVVDAVSPQYLRPASIAVAGSWTGAATDIDETSASDADYIEGPDATGTPNEVIVALAGGLTPATRTAHVLRYRYLKNTAAGDTVNLTTRVVEDISTGVAWATVTTIGSAVTVTNISTATTATITLTEAAANTISNYTKLGVGFSEVKG